MTISPTTPPSAKRPGKRRRRCCSRRPSTWRCKSAACKRSRSTFCLPATCSTSASARPWPAARWRFPSSGMYGACSTMAESLCLAGMFVDSGAAACLAVTSSHFCSAERQFRFPLEYGGQRTPTAQWTATGVGRRVVGQGGQPPFVRGRDGRDDDGPGHHRRQQYGRGHGPRRRADPLPVLCRHRPLTRRTMT